MAEDLIPLAEARRIVMESALARARERAATADEAVPLADALGRTLAQDIRADSPVPAFAGSAMDGYAIRAADSDGASAERPATLTLVGEARAGHPAAVTLAAGQAIAISTGAVLPGGADAVVRVEETRRHDGRVDVLRAVVPHNDVRSPGEDIAAGSTVLARGTRLGPAELGVLASVGCARAPCTSRPTVAVLTTGDELVPPAAPLRPGAVRNSNGFSIPALARAAGARVASAAHAPDDPAATRAALAAALDSDVAIVCGGVSVGEHDHVKGALGALGVERRFAGVALRPGKPAWFGAREGTLVFGLPGNPVSAIVTFILLAGPALRALAGEARDRRRLTAALARDCAKQPGRTHAIRCRLVQSGCELRAEPNGPQGSHVLTSMLTADALALLPAGPGAMSAGEHVEVEPLGRWLGATPGTPWG